jgi:methyl-accepting chemotaxis protein
MAQEVVVAAGQVERYEAAAASAWIAGQRIRGVGPLEIGTHVVVSGLVLPDGSLIARRVSVAGAYVPGASTVILTGVVRRVDAVTGRALVGSAWIDYTPAMAANPQTPRVGEMMHAQGVQPVVGGIVLATVARTASAASDGVDVVRELSLSTELPAGFWSELTARRTGTNGISTGTNGISTGTNGISTGTNGISTGTNGISTGTNGISTGTNGISTGTNGISTGTNGISTGTNGISTGTNGISTGTNGISTGTNGISTGTNGISTGTNGISTGTNGISTGTNGISTGTNGISTGTNGISTGTNGISTGKIL